MTIQHGITITESTDGAGAIVPVATAVIGLVATSADADAGFFPLDRPVLIASGDLDAAIGKAGTAGTLHGALAAINDLVRTPVVVVRVATDPDVPDENALVIGGTVNGQLTGMQALLAAEAVVGVKPRILGCPGLDTQPVTAALAAVAQKLRGFAYAKAIGADAAAAQAYRANFGQRELMLIYDDFLGGPDGLTVSSAVARALGQRARIDIEQGWHKSISNVPVDGVTGIAHPIGFDIMDSGSAAGILNSHQVTALVRRQGYRFWGNRTCAEDGSPFVFEVATRTAQVLIDTIAAGMTWAIDKPLVPSLVKDIVERINGELRLMTAQGFLLGGKAWFDVTKNPQSQLAGGVLKIDYDFAPVPPLEALGLTQHITDTYEATLYSAVAAAGA